jgi:hypothetical protein
MRSFRAMSSVDVIGGHHGDFPTLAQIDSEEENMDLIIDARGRVLAARDPQTGIMTAVDLLDHPGIDYPELYRGMDWAGERRQNDDDDNSAR